MSTPPRRPLSVSDAMILVVAVAVGLAQSRSYHATLVIHPDLDYYTIGRLTYNQWAVLAVPALVPFAPALVAVRLGRPWRPLRRTASEPGFTACVVIGLLWVASLVIGPLIAAMPGPPFTSRLAGGGWLLVGSSYAMSASLGPSIAAAWAVQWLGGRWRPRANWCDRAGRALGIFFIANYLVVDWLRLHL
ncbi:MAG: hypothetical protein U0800_06500 [Isosphaeraceae bacterium]